MSDDPGKLNTENNMIAHVRRHTIQKFESDRAELRRRQEELETKLLSDSSTSWQETATRAQYLIRRFEETNETKESNLGKLIQRTLADLAGLIAETEVSNR